MISACRNTTSGALRVIDKSAGKKCVAEVEILVPTGQLDPDAIHTPGIYVDHLFKGAHFEKRIEQRTTRPAEAVS